MNQPAEQNKLAEKSSVLDTASKHQSSLGYGKTLRSRSQRRSLSGAPLSCLFETKFQHLKAFQKTQNEARGLNFLLAPMSGALYRSSMPVTPIATPLFDQGAIKFNDQSFHERMRARLQSPRKVTNLSVSEPRESISEAPESQLDIQKSQQRAQESIPEPITDPQTETSQNSKLASDDTAKTTSSAKTSSKNSGQQKDAAQKTSRRQRRRFK